MVKKVCRYNGQLVQVQWTFDQNHEIILSTVLAFDCILKVSLNQVEQTLSFLSLESLYWSYLESKNHETNLNHLITLE